ncbi:MAG: 4Fe-4S binding protein, partial [Spirochaetes bacterium]|nr:4Fe-4S binding protein [Spirochaetota bacterium]
SGQGVTPISYLTLAKAVPLGVEISGNGGPMFYRSAADFLALGTKTVQFCTMVMKYGYNVFADLASGVSHLMEHRGIRSMKELIGIAQPNAIRDFMDLSPVKKISDVDKELCVHCGNCTRCPYLAITLNDEKIPLTDASKCIGCSICTQKCPSKALFMRERTKKEASQLKED